MALRDFMRETFGRIERTNDAGDSEDVFQGAISDFWAGLTGVSGFSSPLLNERVWVAARCKHMNANAISTMPLRHYGTREPAWVANPDPVWFPNGISDAVYAIVDSLYGWGDAFVYVTSRYADGYPSAWTVLNPEPMSVEIRRGQRVYESGGRPLNADDMVQISRNPGGIRGSSAIKAYSAYTNGLLAAADLGRVMMASGAPTSVIQSARKIDRAQANLIKDSWVEATASRRGAPAVLGPDLTYTKLGFSAEDLQLLSVQQFSAQVIASAFGVPSALINMPIEGGLTYQTPVLLLEQWWRTELRTTSAHVAAALTAVMLPAGNYVEFDAREFIAPTFAELANAVATLVEKGVLTAEEGHTLLLHHPPSTPIESLMTPPSAGASPAQGNGFVVPLRPTASTSQL